MEPLVKKAHAFATKAHAGVFRNWTGEPYVEHAERVAGHLIELGAPAEVIAAAYLHDVIEDTAITAAEIEAEFGPAVAALVVEVTNPKAAKAEKTAAIVRHLAGASYWGATIKLADMLDNSANVSTVAPAFAKGYLAKMAKKLAVLGHGHPELLTKVVKNLSMTS